MGRIASKGRTSKRAAPRKGTGKVSTARLDEMIEEATVDC